MKTLILKDVNLENLLFGDVELFEQAFILRSSPQKGVAGRTAALDVASSVPATTNNFPEQFAPRPQYVRISRIGQAFQKSPTFVHQGYDAEGCAYGTAQVAGEEFKWKCDGTQVWNTLSTKDEMIFSIPEILRRIALYPVVMWYFGQQAETREFMSRYTNPNMPISADECVRASVHFEYGHVAQHPTVTVAVECTEAQCAPAKERSILKASQSAVMMPWHAKPDIPNDLSVDSARAGKYRLNGNWGCVQDGGKSYDFAADIINPSELDHYIDNEDYRSVLSQVLGYLGSLIRTNKLTLDENTPINDLFANIAMTRSNQQNMMLAGDPGAGKTLLCRMIAATLGLPCTIIRLGERSEKDELTQEVIATDHGFDTIKSKLYWYAKHGGIVVFDDLSNADPNMFFSTVGGLLESPYEYLVNQETVKRHPLCIIMATTNVGTIGSQPINEALLTRFGSHYVVERLSDAELKKCITERARANSGVTLDASVQNAITDWTYNVFTAVTRAIRNIDQETADRLITMRAAIGTAEKIMNTIANGFDVDYTRIACQTMANILYTGGNPILQKAVADAIESTPAFNPQ